MSRSFTSISYSNGPFLSVNTFMKDIKEILKERILVLDGAMGTMIQRYNLSPEDYHGDRFKGHSISLRGNNDILNITRPDVISEIHAAYFEAGADIVETNTFSGTSIAQEDYSLAHLAYEINRTGAELAKQQAEHMMQLIPDKPRFVAGSIGPTNKTASLSPDVNRPGYRAISFDELKVAYREQVEGLIDGGADILLVETVFDTLNAKAALMACTEVFEDKKTELPIMVSGTITDQSGRTLSGQTAEAFAISVSHIPLLSIGLNCALGARQLTPYLEILSKKAFFNISAHPNAGLPNEFGAYDETPEMMAEQIKDYLDKGLVNIIGGCCGTTPDHIAAISELVSQYKPPKRA
mgnify:CR=1 FL=1|jgi:5-methyltetrahydrofolate--homocysteine methyltransferase